jgi:hypothetical protein
MEFEWDEDKAESNERKHGASFTEAETVFGDPLSLTGYDPDLRMGKIVTSPWERQLNSDCLSRSERRDYEDGNFP